MIGFAAFSLSDAMVAAGSCSAALTAGLLLWRRICGQPRPWRRISGLPSPRPAAGASRGRAEPAAPATPDDRQWQALLGLLDEGVITLGRDGRIRGISPQAAAMLGRNAAELPGRPAGELLPDPDDAGRPGGLIQAMAEQGLASREYSGRRPDGTPLELEVAVIRCGGGGAQAADVALLHDISRRRLAEAVDTLVQEVDQRALQGEGMESLMALLCRRLLELFRLEVAWVAAREADGSAVVLGFAGPPPLEDHLRAAHLRWDATPGGRGPAGRTMRLGITQYLCPQGADWNDLLAPFARTGMRAGMAIPLRAGQTVLGALSVYAAHPLDRSIQGKLEELAARIGIAVQVVNDQRRLRLQGAAMETAANAILITDARGHIEWVNEAFSRLSGYSLEESIGKTPRLLRSGAQTDTFYHDLWSTIQSGLPWRGELVERRKDGTLYNVEQTVTPMRDGKGEVSHFVVVHEDITERKRAEERIRYLSSYDPLTGLPNRGQFRERLHQAVARAEATRQPLAVLFLDLDHFSRINDTLGHDLGDRLLAEIVERLTAVTRSADTLARIGGDEFAVILTDRVSGESAAILARRLLDAVVRPYEIDGHEAHLGASIGIVLHPEDGRDAEQLIKNADLAMYRAIREAPNGYRFFSAAMDDEMQARVSLERDLRRALAREEFTLYYQPQMEARSGRLIGLEALLRWHHAERGTVPPGRFIPLAEETGLIAPLGDLVLRLACRQIRQWLDAGLPLVPVAVNLSALQLRRDGLVEEVMAQVEGAGIDSRWLELELTESGVMEDAESAERILRALSERGIKLAIDDFGTGYSSLSYLRRFPVDKLKIDQSFVRRLGENDNDDAIARAIIHLGHSLGMTVVSEGVETDRQLSYLRDQGCDVVQGFLFSRPLPAPDIPPLLAGQAPGCERTAAE